MKTLHCSDAGFDCQAVIHAETEDEVLTQAASHALKIHNTVVTEEMARKIKTLIKEELISQ
jgi:predicted small metal-binding protein